MTEAGTMMQRARRTPQPADVLSAALATSLLATAPSDLQAQQPAQAPSADQLIERLRRAQDETRPPEQRAQSPSAEQLIERLRQLEGDAPRAQPAAPGQQAGQEARAPAPQLSAEQVRQKVQEELGVAVLGVRPATGDGRPTYAVKVMNPPGNYNAAFMVVTLLVDGDTGEVLSEARAVPTAEGPDLLPEVRRPGSDSSGFEIRRRSHR